MAPASTGKALRVALIEGASITEDRTFTRRGPVTVGERATDTFVVPAWGQRSSLTLFAPVGGVYHLAFTDEMEGSLSLGGQQHSLEEVREQGLARRRGGTLLLPLTDDAKGRVAVGGVSLVFQFVAPRVDPPRPPLPPGVRGLVLDSADRLFFGVLGVSLLVHFSGATFLAMQPVPIEQERAMDEVPDRFLKAMMPPARPPVPRSEIAVGEPSVAPRAAPREPREPLAKVPLPPAVGGPEAKAALAAQVAKLGVLAVIGAGAGGEGGGLSEVLESSGVAREFEVALAGARGGTLAEAGPGGPKGSTSGTAVGIDPLGTRGAAAAEVLLPEAAAVAVAVRGGVSMASPDVDSAEVDRGRLTAYVQLRKAAIQQCYERELKRLPTLRGRLVLRFTITTAGRAREVDVAESSLGSPAVGACIGALVRGWVFPFKPDGEVPVAYPFVFAPVG